MSRPRPLLAAAILVALLGASCGYARARKGVQPANPGKCTPVDVAAAPDVAKIASGAASRFNGSRAARLRAGGCAFVRVQSIATALVFRELVSGWHDPADYGPAPGAWLTGSTLWSDRLDATLDRAGHAPITAKGTVVARSPLVVAIPAPMAKALGAPKQAIGWSDLDALARDRRGWGGLGHPEWGPFRWGKGNPEWSTTGLDQAVGFDATNGLANAAALEQSVVSYGDTAEPYFTNWRRLAKVSTADALRYLSAAVTDERSVIAYNTGHDLTDTALTGKHAAPKLPLVAVYPRDATITSEYALTPLNATWVPPLEREGVQAFGEFLLEAAQQSAFANAGFRPARGAPRADLWQAGNGVDATARPRVVEPASPRVIAAALGRWEDVRRRARVLLLVDASNSMGDPSEPFDRSGDTGPTKLARAQSALTGALEYGGRHDLVGLRIFTTQLTDSPSSDWRDVVPMAPLATQAAELRSAIAGLEPRNGSPLYPATRDAFDAVARDAAPQDIDAVVVVTDGYNEVDRGPNLAALLKHLGANHDVRVFTVAYTADADFASLTKIAEATNAWCFDARDPRTLTEQLSIALAST